MTKLKVLSAILALCTCCAVVQGQSISYVLVSSKDDFSDARNDRNAKTVPTYTIVVDGYEKYYLYVVLNWHYTVENLLGWM